ncbi:MAG: hypothetical protein K0S07_480 [Chlamydiales bacterium]|jgi:hypothetical protein|nr:hypothetical protein [Chlamydiales bacterium]
MSKIYQALKNDVNAINTTERSVIASALWATAAAVCVAAGAFFTFLSSILLYKGTLSYEACTSTFLGVPTTYGLIGLYAVGLFTALPFGISFGARCLSHSWQRLTAPDTLSLRNEEASFLHSL